MEEGYTRFYWWYREKWVLKGAVAAVVIGFSYLLYSSVWVPLLFPGNISNTALQKAELFSTLYPRW